MGCLYTMEMSGGKDLCAFCRSPPPTSKQECVKRLNKLMDKGVGGAYNALARYHKEGIVGLPQDWAKINELLLKAGELGCASAYCNLGNSYYNGGHGVKMDKKKAHHYWELAAMGGSVEARNNLGALEGQAGNDYRAFKHYKLAARAGYKESLDTVKKGFMAGLVTKDEYANTLRVYQKSQNEVKSDARDKAEACFAENVWVGY